MYIYITNAISANTWFILRSTGLGNIVKIAKSFLFAVVHDYKIISIIYRLYLLP